VSCARRLWLQPLNKTHLTGFQNPTSMRLHQRPKIGEENTPIQEMLLTVRRVKSVNESQLVYDTL
jgi:hypothetical protein